MWFLSLIPARIQYYGILVLAALAGIFGIYWLGGENKKQQLENKMNKKKLKNIKIAQEIKNEIKAFDNGTLNESASKWLRSKK